MQINSSFCGTRLLQLVISVTSLVSLVSISNAQPNDGYFRAPAIHHNTLVFTAEGDLWKKQIDQTITRRLTTHATEEFGARISPDGKLVAFVANYDGEPEVYVMPLTGGVPQRVSFENSRVRMQGWTPDGQVLYSTDNIIGPANQWVLRHVNPATLETGTFPLLDAIEGSMSTDGSQIYFTRFGLQATADNARVYRGGAKGQIWRYATGSVQEAQHLTADHEGSARRPMYWNGRVYFLSDADGTPNLWSMTSNGSDFRQHTTYSDFQVWDANQHNGRIVYQRGADLYLYTIATGKTEPLAIELTSDFTQRQERWLPNPVSYLTDVTYQRTHDDTDQLVLTARGQVAIASTGTRRVIELQTPPSSRTRYATMSPDGAWVYAVNDHSGENEIWRFPTNNRSEGEQLTSNGGPFRSGIHLAPDGQSLAHHDHRGHLYLLDLATKEEKLVFADSMPSRGYSDVQWSHDGSLLTFTIENRHAPSRNQVVIYDIAQQTHAIVTSEKYESYSPAFSQDGNWLYFLSDRTFTPTPTSPWGDRNMGPMFDKRTQIFAVALKPDACFPFAEPTEIMHCNDALASEQTVDFSGLAQRLWQVPIAADNYFNLQANKDRLYVQTRAAGWGTASSLYSIAFSATDVKRERFASHVTRYALSQNGMRLFFQQTGQHNMFVVNAGASAPNDLTQARIATRNWQLAFSPREEWQQMFRDAWLMHREFLFDVNMRGVDWDAMYTRYQPLVARLTDRHELDDLLAQLLSELNVLHSQVRGGEYRQPNERPGAATLGAQFQLTARGVQIKTIYRVDPELPNWAAPLAAPGVDAQEGDIITHVNGRPVAHIGELLHALRGTAGRQVLLTLIRSEEEDQEIQTVVRPVDGQRDHRLRYETWVQNNRARVQEASSGRYGYLHLYAMGANDISSFAREFYANFQKDGLIIDVRRNRGGNIDSWVLEKLLRRAWAFWQRRGGGDSFTNMQQAFTGQLVVLADQLTYSDGETFSAGVRALELGPVIGMQTAGAGVWLSDRNRLSDRGLARVAELGQYAVDGRWILEGSGVTPDIVVDNLPWRTFQGHDAQLERALEVLDTLVEQSPRPLLIPGPLTAPVGNDIR